jgi:biotin-(acetyl-CoA carboxylase) ligase
VRFSAIPVPICSRSNLRSLRHALGYNDPNLKVPIRDHMPSETRLTTPFATALDLPPGFRVVTLREVGDAFAHAKANAAALGAGTLVFVGRFDLAEFAVVLEPDEPLRTARRAFYAGMAALTDALTAHAPPEKPIVCVWPDSIYVDQGLVGGAQFAWSDGPEDQPPDWLVFGGMIRTVSMAEGEPGVRPLSTAIEEEGFDEAGAAELVGSFARHLLVQVDAWQEYGFKEIAKTYLARLAPEKSVRRDIDDNGDLLVRRVDRPDVERRSLIAALAKPSWFDAKARGPK